MKTHAIFHETEIISTYANVSKLPFLKLSGGFNYLVCEFMNADTNETIGLLYANPAEPFSLIGYGLLDGYIGKGLGEELIVKSLICISRDRNVNQFVSNKNRCNQYSRNLMEKMKNSKDITVEENDNEFILKIKT